MLKVNVADYLIHNLSGVNFDNNGELVSQTIDLLIDSWSDNKYLSVKPDIEYRISPDRIIFGKKSLHSITNC